VVLETGKNLAENDLKIVIKGMLASYKQPKKIFFVDELPRNTMGKVLKNNLREAHKNYFL
jgi:malonyl-CoA/methylmalonyl-CoA synthetase